MKRSHRICSMVCLVMAALYGVGAVAETADEERARLLAEFSRINGDDKLRDAAKSAGFERSSLCAHCHGADGNSVRNEVPNLAGQNPAYLFEQIGKFADGRRKNFVMQTLAADFSEQDKINLAVYYNNQAVGPTGFDPVLATRGQATYQSTCLFCHGKDGRGEEGYARLAGQQPEYVMNTLKRFRANAHSRVQPGEASVVKRSNARMEQVTQNLTDDEVTALAAYIASLR